MAKAGSREQRHEFKRQRPVAPCLLLVCFVACNLLPVTLLARTVDDGTDASSSACVKYVSALESALQRDDVARAQHTISDFFSRLRAPPLKRCFLFRSGTAFHSLGHSAACWNMFSAFFDAFPDHKSAIDADSQYATALPPLYFCNILCMYAAAYAKGGTCAAVEGHGDAAASLLQLAVRLQPQDSQSWNNLANVYRSMGLTQKALDA
jgi:hypothetical protein